ncbi:MAG: excinuclease ABC subunit C [Rhodospirillales bacterium]|nr:excinuclease ABC subunit C [Acetobacter sp.]
MLTKRLNLRDRIRWIEWTTTGSEFESVLLLYRATHALFGEQEARKRLRLHCPYFLRVTMGHEHPRVFVSNRMSRRALRESFGPFASRAAAERVAEAVGDLFKVRRCHEDLEVHADHPGCAYGEMGRCLAPCKSAVTGRVYRAEAERAFAYLRTQGESLMQEVATKRDAASDAMNFEQAASLHRQWEKVHALARSADPLVRAATDIKALIIQPAAAEEHNANMEAALFLLDGGRLVGPARLSTLGVRAVREQTAVGSSLFAQPLMLEAVSDESRAQQNVSSPEDRARAALLSLEEEARRLGAPEPSLRGDALALFKRWYYRPEKQRQGEALLPNADGTWPVRKLLNAAARIVLGPPTEMPGIRAEQAVSSDQTRKTRGPQPEDESIRQVAQATTTHPRKRRPPGQRGQAIASAELL